MPIIDGEPPAREDTGVRRMLRGGTVADGTGGAPRRASVVVAGDRIEALLPPEAPAPSDAIVHDCSRTLSPCAPCAARRTRASCSTTA
jgi:hypothetical protein